MAGRISYSVLVGLENSGYHPSSHAFKEQNTLWTCHSPILSYQSVFQIPDNETQGL
jgi:hypothetical protein